MFTLSPCRPMSLRRNIAHRVPRRFLSPLLLLVLVAGLAPPLVGQPMARTAESPPGDSAHRRQVMNLHGFTRLYGFVRYFHPSDEASRIDWDKMAIYGAARVLDAPDADVLAERLEEIFRPVAPTLRVHRAEVAPPPEPRSPSNIQGLTLTAWQYIGPGAFGEGPFQAVRVRPGVEPLFDEMPKPDANIDGLFTQDLSIALPTVLWSDENGTWPAADPVAFAALEAELAKIDLAAWDSSDPAHRSALVVILWTLYRHFYPHFDVAGTDWERRLFSAHDRMLKAYDDGAVLNSLREVLVSLSDGQAGVSRADLDNVQAWLPLSAAWLNGYAGVTVSKIEGIRPGDLLRRVNRSGTTQVMNAVEAYTSGSSRWRRGRALDTFGKGPAGQEVTVVVDRDGEEIEVRAKRDFLGHLRPFEGEPIRHLDGGALVVDLEAAKTADIHHAFEELGEAPGVVFDLRGRGLGAGNEAILGHLIDAPVQSAEHRIQRIIEPDQKKIAGWETTVPWTLEPVKPRLRVPVVFLVDGLTHGAAERLIDIALREGLGEVVGERTAGFDGAVHRFTLPGGFEVQWTAGRVDRSDGEQFPVLGIPPTVQVDLSREALAQGRDEVMEKAVELLSGE